MGRNHWNANLDELCRSLEHYVSSLPAAPSSSATAARLSDSLYLANSASDANFSAICDSGYLFSAARLGKSMPPTCPEMILGTAGSVFFYFSPSENPTPNAGLLLPLGLKSKHKKAGVPTLFVSAGLVKNFPRRI